MFKYIKKIFSKKVVYLQTKVKHETTNAFLLDRPSERISLRKYYDNRIYNNEFYNLNVEIGLIIPIDLSNNKHFENYITHHYFFLREEMMLKKRTFIKGLFDLKLPTNLNLNYYFPFISKIDLEILKDTQIKTLLNFIGYSGNITTGFLSFTDTGVSFIGIKEIETVEDFVKEYLENLQVINYKSNIFYSLEKGSKGKEPNIELDKETQLLLNEIESNLTRLKQLGQFFLIAPKLEKIIAHTFSENSIVLSDIVIDEDFRIFLPHYNNTEITLSHLTKAIYILFLKHPEGILLENFPKYESELFSIYQAISYQVSFDKMKNSIHELITDNKAIFVHFSRIKSTFVKQFTDFYAEYYYIKGSRGEIKYIKLPKENIVFKTKI